MLTSSTQQVIRIFITKAELAAGVTEAQDMLYDMRVIQSMGLDVKKSMILEMENNGAVDLANN